MLRAMPPLPRVTMLYDEHGCPADAATRDAHREHHARARYEGSIERRLFLSAMGLPTDGPLRGVRRSLVLVKS